MGLGLVFPQPLKFPLNLLRSPEQFFSLEIDGNKFVFFAETVECFFRFAQFLSEVLLLPFDIFQSICNSLRLLLGMKIFVGQRNGVRESLREGRTGVGDFNVQNTAEFLPGDIGFRLEVFNDDNVAALELTVPLHVLPRDQTHLFGHFLKDGIALDHGHLSFNVVGIDPWLIPAVKGFKNRAFLNLNEANRSEERGRGLDNSKKDTEKSQEESDQNDHPFPFLKDAPVFSQVNIVLSQCKPLLENAGQTGSLRDPVSAHSP